MYTIERLNDGSAAGGNEAERDGYGFGWGIFKDPALGLLVNHSGVLPGLGTWYERGVDTDRVFVFLQSRAYEDDQAYWSFAKGMVSMLKGQRADPLVGIDRPIKYKH